MARFIKKGKSIGYMRPGANHKNIPSAKITRDSNLDKIETRYEGELAEREKEAQELKEARKKRVAPLYSKGAYQFIGDNPDSDTLKALGRKI